MPSKKTQSLLELQTATQLRSLIAEEVEAKANIEQANALKKQTRWTKLMAIATFLMAFATFLLVALQYFYR